MSASLAFGKGMAGRLLAGLLLALLALAPLVLRASTPSHISAANELRLCLWERGGLRGAERANELQRGIDRYRTESGWALSEIAQGIYRVSRARPSGLTAEIKLPDASGAAYCLLFGPGLQPGDAVKAADTFVQFGYLKGLVAATPTPGVDRRYVAQGLPFSMELIAYRAEGVGEMVGLVFSGLNAAPAARQLTAGRPEVSHETVRAYMAWAVETCVRNLGKSEWMVPAIEKGGFVFGWNKGGGSNERVYFLPDNSLSVAVSAIQCEIDTRYVGVAEAQQLVRDTLNRAFPGQFQERPGHSSQGYCPGFGRDWGDMPYIINVEDLDDRSGRSCLGNGASRISFEVAG